MVCLPLIERELRVALRKQRPAQGRLKVAALAVGGSMLFLLFGALIGNRGVGQGLEQILCVAGLYFVLRAPMLTAGALAEERRNQTLGLLFLSGLGAGEVFVSKFLSSALIAFTNLLAIYPVLALPFLIGGVSYDLFIAVVCALPVLMFFALAVSLLASALTKEDSTAVVLANVLGALLCLLTPAIYLAQAHFSPLASRSLWWLRLSPAYGPYLVWRGFGSGFHAAEQAEFWQNVALTLGWSVCALGAAAFALKRLWREQQEGEGTGRWRKRWEELVHGGRENRRRLGRVWLDENPFVWLAGRDRQPAMLCWLVVGGIVLTWLLCWAVWLGQWPSEVNFFITATLLNSVLAWLTRHAAAQEIGLARRDGAYELLLTTPLNPGDIVHGIMEGLQWRFRALANFVLWLNVLLMLGGLLLRGWNAGALFVYLSLWLALLTWIWRLGHYWGRVMPVMWASLNCGRPAYAAWRASNYGQSNSRWWYWIWVWNIYNFHIFGRGFQQFPTGSGIELFVASAIVVIWLLWFAAHLFAGRGKVRDFKWDPLTGNWLPARSPKSEARDIWRDLSIMRARSKSEFPKSEALDRIYETRLISEFREIVGEPLPDPSDPRFKKWDVRERFPWGWGLVQQQLHERLVRRLTEPS